MSNKLWDIIAAGLKKNAPETFKKIQDELAVKLAEVKTKDGKVISVDGEIAKGSAAYVMNEAGEKVTCPDGTYETDKGKITVTGGLISDLVAAEAAAAPTPEELAAKAAAEAAAKPAQFSKEEVEKYFTEQIKQRDELITKLTARLDKVEKSNVLFAELTEAMKTVEVDLAAQTVKTVKKKPEEMTALDRYNEANPLPTK